MTTSQGAPQGSAPAISRRTLARLGLAAGAGAATTVAAAGSASAVTSTFRVGHLNILSTISHADFLHDLNLIAGHCHLLGLNEVQFRRDELRNWADSNGWHLYMPSGTWPGAEPLLARKSMFRATSSGDRGSTFVCDTGGSAEPPPPRYLTWISWEHLPSGRHVNHINSHLNAHIDDNGSPYALPRTGDAEKHIRMIRDLAVGRSDNGQVVVSGDFNVDYQDDKRVQYSQFPYTVLEERQATGAIPGLRSGYSQLGVTNLPTLGSRRIDYIYEWVRVPSSRLMEMTNHYVVDGTRSDHNGVVAAFSMTH
ncbi:MULTISPECIES: hypothetical protein [unclassified Knoellia]|uniref:hypothetical protein n=1 Tax=Knoellia altitudinis TaxID=3404795 RepID=UPI00361A4353